MVAVQEIHVKQLVAKGKVQLKEEKSQQNESKWAGLDPLSAALHSKKRDTDDEDDDPLSQLANQPPVKTTSLHQIRRSSSLSSHSSSLPVVKGEDDLGWQTFRQEILSSHSTTSKLSFKSSFISGGTVVTKTPVQSISVTDKVKNRLEQLDEMMDDVREEHNLTQKEYVLRIEELNRQLIAAWSTDQRVKALKITIQSAKMLADPLALDFYPSKFALVSDILDTFGNLVYARIQERSITSTIEQAIETCRNWFFKIASIRELIPRFYVETSIIKVYSFIASSGNKSSCPGSISSSIRRLSNMIRGISDPLVASYARLYLSHVAVKVMQMDKVFFRNQIEEMYTLMDQFPTHVVQDSLDSHRMTIENYCHLYSPCLEWLCRCLAHDASD